jgi:hypothetical protein
LVDQGYKTFMGGAVVNDPRAPNLVEAQNGCVDSTIDLFGGRLSLNAEIDMGHHDTLVDTLDRDRGEIDRIAWYDPQVPEAVGNVFNAFKTGKNYAFTLGASGLIDGYKYSLSGSQIAPSYFSGGNPYLEVDRREINLTGEKDFSEKVSGSLECQYQKRSISTSPVDNLSARLGSKYSFGRYLPELGVDYVFYYEASKNRQTVSVVDTVDSGVTSVDSAYSFRYYKNLIGLEARQQFANNMDYSIKYQVLLASDATKYLFAKDMNKRDGIQHQVTGRYGFRLGKNFRNKTTLRLSTKNEVLDSLKGLSYKVSDEMKFSIIPRKLTLNLKGEYSNRLDKKAENTTSIDTLVHLDILTRFSAFETEVKYTLNAKWSLTLNTRFEKALDQTPGSHENYSVWIGGFHTTYLF